MKNAEMTGTTTWIIISIMSFRPSFFSLFTIAIIAAGAVYHVKFREETPEDPAAPRSAHTRTGAAADEVEPAVASYLGVAETAPAGKPTTMLHSAIESVSSIIRKEEVEEEGPNPLLSLESESPDLHLLLEKHFRELFLRKGARSFTKRRHDAGSIVIQLNDLRLDTPIAATLSEEEQESGVEERIYFSIRANGWREYAGETWGPWQRAKPPMLSGFTFEKRNGTWELDSSPAEWYSLN